MFKKILRNGGMGLVAVTLISAGAPWINFGVGLLLLAAILTLFNVRDAICVGLRRFGMAGEQDRVFVHLCAAVMALLALTVAFGEVEARMHAIRWYLLIGLPMIVYLFSFLYEGLQSFIVYIDRKATAHKRKRLD